MKNLKSINELFGNKSKKPERSDKEEKILQKAISMIEDTDKIESGEYITHLWNGKYSFDQGEAEFKLDRLNNFTVYFKNIDSNYPYKVAIFLTEGEASSIRAKFKKAYEIQHTPKREKAKKTKEEIIDKFLDL